MANRATPTPILSGGIATRAEGPFGPGSPAGLPGTPFPEGRQSDLAGYQGFTNPLVRARYVEAQAVNPLELDPQKWTPWTVQVPTILAPVSAVRDLIYFAPLRIPSPFTSLAGDALPGTPVSGTSGTFPNFPSQRSFGRGIVYLPQPGTWYLYWRHDGSTTAKLQMVAIDASDPGVLSRYMAEPGCHGCKRYTAAPAATSAATLIGSANQDRTGLLIQNTGSTRLSVALGEAGATGVGLSLTAGSTLSLSGTTLIKAEVNVFNEGASPGAVVAYEYF